LVDEVKMGRPPPAGDLEELELAVDASRGVDTITALSTSVSVR